MIEDLHHLQLAIPREAEDAARRFYAGVLGFREVEKPAALAGRGGLWLEKGPVRLHLGIEEPFHPASKAHPAFRVASLDDAVERLAAAEVAFQHGVDLPGVKRVFVSDPFGNRIELLEVHSGP